MPYTDILAKILSFGGLLFIVASYQQKNKTPLIICQSIGGALFGIHYLLIGAYAGFLLNTIAMARGIVFARKLSKNAGRLWVGIFIALCLIAYVLTFTLFGMEPSVTNLILELLPTIGMIVLTISFNMTHAGHIRILGSINSAGWLSYNIAHQTPFGILCEIICLGSIVIGILRHDIKKKS